ncbi:MAG: DUF3619 family protein [Pseudomonadota bacterium]
MTTIEARAAQNAVDHYGARMARRLSAGTDQLPYEITERLRAARTQAVAQRKLSTQLRPAGVLASGAAAVLGGGDEGLNLWSRIASALPLLALIAGLVFIHTVQSERRAAELAEVDTALLTDDLPPAAYADPGFVLFLKSGRE